MLLYSKKEFKLLKDIITRSRLALKENSIQSQVNQLVH